MNFWYLMGLFFRESRRWRVGLVSLEWLRQQRRVREEFDR